MATSNTGSAKLRVGVMRSQLGQVRGLGAARSGVHHWWLERVTSLALIPLTLWFIYVVMHLAGHPLPFVAHFVARPVNTVLFVLLIVTTFWHMMLGLQVVIEDYVHGEPTKLFSLLAMKAVTVILGLMCLVSVLKLAFTTV